jgi:deoxyhypusine synthase
VENLVRNKLHRTRKVDEICRQCICNNSLITIAGRPVVNNHWTDKMFIKMKDLTTDDGTLLTEENINRMYNVQFKPLEYNSLISAIPKKWKKILNENHADLQLVTKILECELQIYNIKKPIDKIETKDVYRLILSRKSKRPTSEDNGKKILNST